MASGTDHRLSFESCRLAGLAVVILLTGCVAGDLEVDPDRKAAIREIAVHPIEPPRLVVPSEFQLGMESVGGSGEVLGVLGILIGGVVLAARAESIGDEAEKFENYAGELDSDQVWHPTEIVAQQVASLLEQKHVYEVRVLLPMTKLFKGGQKSGLDPYGPIRTWYNGSRLGSGARNADSDVVIEAGVWNYELAQDVLILCVVLRAVDPVGDEVLGRARVCGLPPAADVDALFADDAQQFKALFTETSSHLTRQALDQLGF